MDDTAAISPPVSLPFCSIIVLNWNGAARLRVNLPALLALDYPDHEIIVVDNGSTDDSCDYVRSIMSAQPVGCLRLLPLRRNWGYCRGKHVGARFARGKYLWLLDDDIRVHPQSLRQLVEFMELFPDQRVLAMPILKSEQNAEITLNGGIAITFHGPTLAAASADWPTTGQPYPIHAPTGGVLFIPRSYWNELGGFDRRAPFHLDDLDLGTRALLSGGSAWCQPEAMAFHPPYHAHKETAQLRRFKQRWQFQNGPAYILRNFQWRHAAFMLPACLVVQLLQLLKWGLVRGDVKVFLIWLQAWHALLQSLSRLMRQRKKIQSTRRRRDNEFLFTANFWKL